MGIIYRVTTLKEEKHGAVLGEVKTAVICRHSKKSWELFIERGSETC